VQQTHSAEALAAYDFLASREDPIAELVRAHGPVDFTLPSYGTRLPDHVGRLTLSIVGQVISVRAALRIYGLLAERLGGAVTPEALAQADEAGLRAVGITLAKARSLRALGAELVAGSFSFDELEQMTDAQAEARLKKLRGIGPWSAQMFLLRSLGRPDVFPAGDLGLRRGIELLDALPATPSVAQAAERALVWHPYRSSAAKHLWLRYAARDALVDVGGASDRDVQRPVMRSMR
jgi:DNA-3-methyladenine glycosylase II